LTWTWYPFIECFARLENKQKDIEEDSEDEEDEEMVAPKKKRKQFVFTGDFGKKVFTEMLDVGYWLGKQLDPDKTRTHFQSGYLPKAGKGDDNATGKKQAHEMRGVC